FLRRHERGWPAFFLERARLVVVPVGLDAVVREMLGRNLSAGGPGLDFALAVVKRLRQVLEHDGQACRIDAGVDSTADFSVDPAGEESLSISSAAGLTAWDEAAAIKNQLRTAGMLHAVV